MFTRLYLLTIFCLLAFFLHAGAFPDDILFKNYAEQYRYRDSLFSRINSLEAPEGLQVISSLEKWADTKGDAQLRYGFMLMEYQFRIWRNMKVKKTPADSAAENGLTGLNTTLKKYKIPLLRAEVLYELGLYYWRLGVYAPAFENFIHAYNIYSHYDVIEFPAKPAYLFEFAGKYYHFRDFNTAKKYLLESYHTIPADKNVSFITTLNTLALCYRSLAMFDSAEYYLDTAYTFTMKGRSHNIWEGILSGNLGSIYYLEGKYDSAQPMIEKDIAICLEDNRESFNAANSLSLLSDIYLKKGDRQKALNVALQAYTILITTEHISNYEIIGNIYYKLSKAYAASGNPGLAYNFMDSAMITKDSATKQANTLVLAGVQYQSDADKHIEALLAHERENMVETWIRNGLIAGIILIVIIALLLINRQKLKHNQDEQNLLNEKIQANIALESASRQLSDFTRIVSEKNEMIEHFSAEMNRLRKNAGAIADALHDESVLKLQRSTILTEDQWTDFLNLFETVHKGFLKRLNKKVKGLSPVDIRFMLLSKLHLSNREMASVLGVSTDAVKQNKSRLHERLSLPPGEHSLEDFAATI